MTGRLTRIEKTINSQLDALHIKLIPRGIPYFVDSLLRGTIRFGKRTGNSSSLINNDNAYQYARNVLVGQSRFDLKYKNTWINVGSILSFSNKEKHIVNDVINETTVILEDYLKFSYSADTEEVVLYASPVVPLNFSIGSSVINVNSNYLLANGDSIAYMSNSGVIQSLTEIKIKKAIKTGISSDPIFTYNYNLELEKPVSRSIGIEEKIYIRAYPAYFSGNVKVPNLYNSTNQMGPFLLDYLSGRIVEGFNPKETFSIKLKDRSSQYQLGDANSYFTAHKNYPILNRPISSKSFMFFENIEGDTRIKPNKIVISSNNYNYRTSYNLVPKLNWNGQSYRFTTQSNSSGTLVLDFNDGTRIEKSISIGNQSHEINIPAGERSRIELIFIGDSQSNRLEMSDWTQVGPQIETIEYSMVFESVGRGKFQSTSLMLKPYFLTPEILSGRYDTGDNYDSGFVYF